MSVLRFFAKRRIGMFNAFDMAVVPLIGGGSMFLIEASPVLWVASISLGGFVGAFLSLALERAAAA